MVNSCPNEVFRKSELRNPLNLRVSSRDSSAWFTHTLSDHISTHRSCSLHSISSYCSHIEKFPSRLQLMQIIFVDSDQRQSWFRVTFRFLFRRRREGVVCTSCCCCSPLTESHSLSFPFPSFLTHLKPVVDGFDDDFLWCILRHIEPQFENLSIIRILNEGRIQSIQPCAQFTSMCTVSTRWMWCCLMWRGVTGRWNRWLPKELVLSILKLGPKAIHFILHLSHLGFESFPNGSKVTVDQVEVRSL